MRNIAACNAQQPDPVGFLRFANACAMRCGSWRSTARRWRWCAPVVSSTTRHFGAGCDESAVVTAHDQSPPGSIGQLPRVTLDAVRAQFTQEFGRCFGRSNILRRAGRDRGERGDNRPHMIRGLGAARIQFGGWRGRRWWHARGNVAAIGQAGWRQGGERSHAAKLSQVASLCLDPCQLPARFRPWREGGARLLTLGGANKLLFAAVAADPKLAAHAS